MKGFAASLLGVWIDVISVAPEGLDPISALILVKPAILENSAKGINAILNADIGRNLGLKARCHRDFVDGAPCS